MMLRPSEWGNDETMALMFAPFGPRDQAPATYDRKMSFWTAAIRRRCQSKRSATFSVQRLAGEFERYGQTASCLSTVIEYMTRSIPCRTFPPRIHPPSSILLHVSCGSSVAWRVRSCYNCHNVSIAQECSKHQILILYCPLKSRSSNWNISITRKPGRGKCLSADLIIHVRGVYAIKLLSSRIKTVCVKWQSLRDF